MWGGGREWQVGISGCRQGLSAPRGSCAGGVDLQGGYYVPEDATAVPEEDALRLPSSDPQVQLRRPTRPHPLSPLTTRKSQPCLCSCLRGCRLSPCKPWFPTGLTNPCPGSPDPACLDCPDRARLDCWPRGPSAGFFLKLQADSNMQPGWGPTSHSWSSKGTMSPLTPVASPAQTSVSGGFAN